MKRYQVIIQDKYLYIGFSKRFETLGEILQELTLLEERGEYRQHRYNHCIFIDNVDETTIQKDAYNLKRHVLDLIEEVNTK